MEVNRTIVVSVILIMAAGAYQVLVVKTPNRTLTRVLVGGYILGLIVSVVDLIGGPVSQVAGWILLLALGTALLAVIPDAAKRLGGFFQ